MIILLCVFILSAEEARVLIKKIHVVKYRKLQDMLTITDLKRKPDIIDEGNKIVVAFFCRYLICLAC